MDYIISCLIDFAVLFIVVYLVYVLFINRKRKEYKEGKKTSEIHFFIAKYNLDMRKTEYKKVLNVLTLINSFILAFTSTVVINIESFMFGLLVGFVIIMVLIYSLYEIAGRYFKRKENK